MKARNNNGGNNDGTHNGGSLLDVIILSNMAQLTAGLQANLQVALISALLVVIVYELQVH
jgi:hypothetical protein